MHGRHYGEVVDRKAYRELIGVVFAVDKHVALVPDALFPFSGAFVRDLVKGLFLCFEQLAPRGVLKAEQAAAVALSVAVCIYNTALFKNNVAA